MAKRSRFSNGMVVSNGRPTSTNPSGETVLLAVNYYSVTFNPASVAASTTAEQDVTVPGVQAGDVVLAVNKPSLTAGLSVGNARVKAANTISLTFNNATAGAVDAASENYIFVVGRFATE